jgi:hypothetical protein
MAEHKLPQAAFAPTDAFSHEIARVMRGMYQIHPVMLQQ